MRNYKEWLNTETFEYKQAACMFGHSKWIEIPAGAEIAILDDERLSFAKPINGGDGVLVFDVGRDLVWDTTKWDSWAEFIDYGFNVVWQRDQDEPFLTPETTLNDQEVRQHKHYFKDVSDLNEIDVYMVLKLFNVTDPCLQHIVKKALCAGQRGHKDLERDLKDILDTAKRAVDINKTY